MHLGDRPPDTLDSLDTWWVHQVALATTFWWCSVQRRVGSRMTPKYLYFPVTLTQICMIIPFGFDRLRSPGGVSFEVRGKFITANLLGLKGELCEVDQSNPPFERSIIFLSIFWASWRFWAIARNIESSTKPAQLHFSLLLQELAGRYRRHIRSLREGTLVWCRWWCLYGLTWNRQSVTWSSCRWASCQWG